MKRILYGDPATGRGGLAHIVETMADTIYGSPKNPNGLVQDVSSIKNTIKIATGGIIVAQFAIQILLHFWK